jgi:hypothetical protein
LWIEAAWLHLAEFVAVDLTVFLEQAESAEERQA